MANFMSRRLMTFVFLMASGLLPNWVAYAAAQEVPVKSSICELRLSSPQGRYTGRLVSVRAMVRNDTHFGAYLSDESCKSELIKMKFPDTPLGGVGDLERLIDWSQRNHIPVKFLHCVCIGRIEDTPGPTLFLEQVEEIWIPPLTSEPAN